MLLIAGATGKLGGLITLRLLEKGESVRVLLRKDSPAAGIAHQGRATDPRALLEAGAEPVYGDLRDPRSVEAACQNIKTVVSTATAMVRDGDLEAVDRIGMQGLIEVSKKAGVEQFVYVSVFGAQPQHPVPIFDAKGQCEAALKASGMTYTILQPYLFIEGWVRTVVGKPLQAGAPVTLVKPGASLQAFVTIRDVAEYAVRSAGNPAAFDRAIPIACEKPYSWTEVAALSVRIAGLDLPIRYVEPGETIPLIPEGTAWALADQEQSDTVIDMAETSRTFGIPPTPMEVVLRQLFGS